MHFSQVTEGSCRTSTILSAVSSVFLAKAPHWCCTGLTRMAVTKYDKYCKTVLVSVFGHSPHICLHLKINPLFYQWKVNCHLNVSFYCIIKPSDFIYTFVCSMSLWCPTLKAKASGSWIDAHDRSATKTHNILLVKLTLGMKNWLFSPF